MELIKIKQTCSLLYKKGPSGQQGTWNICNAHTNDSFKYLKILKLPDLYHFSLCPFMYKTLTNDGDKDLKQLVSAQTGHHEYLTRNRSKFILPYYSKTRSQYSFHYNGIKAWNLLPSTIREKSTLKVFKSNLESYFLSRY
jgi:hypothetical protein